MQPRLSLEKYVPQPCNPGFFSRNTRPSHATQAFSREMRALVIHTQAFLEKYRPQPWAPKHFSRNTRHRYPDQALPREIRTPAMHTRVFLEKYAFFDRIAVIKATFPREPIFFFPFSRDFPSFFKPFKPKTLFFSRKKKPTPCQTLPRSKARRAANLKRTLGPAPFQE